MFQQTPQKRVQFPRALMHIMAGGFVVLALLSALLAFRVQPARAATNSTLNFQARLETASGAIVPDGYYNVEFKLYSVSSAGSALWIETYYDANGATAGSDNRIQVRNGYVTANLGSLTAFPGTINWDQDLWVTMNIGGTTQTATPTWDGEMNPRLKLTGVPYAFRAGQLATFNNTTGFTSTLSILQPTGGNQVFQIQDQGAAGTYNLCVQNSASCGFTPATGSASYIQNQNASQQTSTNFWISGTGRADTALQAPSFDTPSAVALNIGTTNATSVTLGRAGVNTFVGGNLSVGTAQSFGAITMANGAWFTAVDAAGTGSVNMFQVNGSNQIQVGAALNIDGGIILPTNGGQMTLIDLGIDTSATAGAKQSYTLRVGSTNALTVYGEADGAGNAQNVRVAIGTSISPQYTMDVTGIINATTEYRINGTQGMTVTCSGGNMLSNQVVQGGIVTGGTCAAGGSGGAGITTVGTFNGATSYANGASISGSTITFGAADATNPGLVSTSDQTFAGNKTFTGLTTLQPASGDALAIKSPDGTKSITIGYDGVNVAINGVGQNIVFDDGTYFGGNVQISNNSNFSQSGTGTFSTGTGAISLNGNVTVATGQSITLVGGITSTRPASPTAGMLYFDQTTGQLLTYTGGKWQADRSPSTKIVAASNSSQAAKDAADYVTDGDAAGAGDGDQIQINAALTAAAGGKVYLVEGTYVVDSAILIPDNTALTGAGGGTVIEMGNIDITKNVIENINTTNGVGVVVQDLTINGRKDLNTAGTQYGIMFNGLGGGCAGSSPGGGIKNVTIQNMRDMGMYLNCSSNFSITGSFFRSNGRSGASNYGLFMVTNNNNIVSGNSFVNNLGYGIGLNAANYSTFTGNIITGSDGYGIDGYNTFNSLFTNNIIQNSTSSGIYLGGSNNTISANKIVNSGGSTRNNGIYLSNDSNVVTSNNITDSSATTDNYAIYMDSPTAETNYLSDNMLGGGSIYDLGTGTIYVNQSDAAGNLINRSAGGGLSVGKTTAGTSADIQGGLRTTQLPTPTAPTLATAGTAGTTTYGYKVSALDGLGETLASTETTIATGNATLTATNRIAITWKSVGGAVQYKIYRTTSGGTPATTGLIAIAAGNATTLNDTGLAASGAVAAANTTGGIQAASSLVLGMASAVSGRITLSNATNANTVSIVSGATSASYALTLPTALGSSGDCLKDTTGSGVLGFGVCGVTTVGGLDGGTANATGATISGVTIYLQSASTSYAGLVNTTTQSFAGNKTFMGNVTVAAGQSISLVGGITSTRPASPTAGMLYFDTTTGQLLTYSGSKWQADRDSNT
ncbi:MAG: exported protein of unknown function, partial [Candidatus Saccharibacteria bacterium]|nr:exported protein of unknown function [Candidatus Saccharibacteria bacterium]